MIEKKKVIILGVVLATLVGVALYVTNKANVNNLSDKELTNYQVDDTASIDEIYIKDHFGQYVHLYRQDNNSWQDSAGVKVQQSMINTLFKTVSLMRVKSLVSEGSAKATINQITNNHREVILYNDGSIVKHYFIGGSTPDHYGTFMLLQEGSKISPIPHVVWLPGHNGILTPRFDATIAAWRDPEVIRISPKEIQQVTIKDLTDETQSFSITALSDSDFEFRDYQGTVIENFPQNLMRNYLLGYKRNNYNYHPMFNERQQDSVKTILPKFKEIAIEMKDGEAIKFSAYRMRKTDTGMTGEYDANMFWGQREGGDLVACQFYVFDPIFINPIVHNLGQ